MKSFLRIVVLCLAALALRPATAQTTAATGALGAAGADTQSTFSLVTGRLPITELDGLWRFHEGDDPHWADPHFNDSAWRLVQGEYNWAQNDVGQISGFAWYRLRVTVPPGEDSYALRLPPIYTAYQAFVDGRPVYGQGDMPPHGGLFIGSAAVLPLTSEARAEAQTLLVAIRIWHDPVWAPYMAGGLHGEALAGRTDLLQAQFANEREAHLWSYSDDFDLGALYLLAFVIALALFFSRRLEVEYFWFSLLALGQAGSHAMNAWKQIHAQRLAPVEDIQYLCYALFLIASLLFFKALLGARANRTLGIAVGCAVLNFLISVGTEVGVVSSAWGNFWGVLLEGLIFLWILLLIHRRVREHRPYARLLAPPMTLLALSLLYQDTIWWLQTAGLSFAAALEIRIRHPFYLKPSDLAEAFFLVAMLAILLSRFARTRREQDRVASELEAARSVQQVLVPESLPAVPGLRINTAYFPAEEVGGDFFQVLPLRSGATLIVLGDVAGKGLPAALTVSLAVGALRTIADYTESPGEVLAGLNRRLYGRGSGFTTCLALHLPADVAVLTVANAGHLPPYVNGFELHTPPSLPLGLDPTATFEESRWALAPGDHLVALTDGIPEAMQNGDLFGFERTAALSRGSAEDVASAARNFGQQDDITVLAVDILAVAEVSVAPAAPALMPA